jgi:transcription elongation GreA/GreB family factor
MPEPRVTRKLIEAKNFDALEDQWIRQMTEEPEDLDFFIRTSRSLAASGEEDRAREFLELLDDHLKEEEDWISRERILEKAGHLLFEPDQLHGAILENLEHIHGQSPVLEPLTVKLGLHRAVSDIPKTWTKVRQLHTLMQFDEGAIVWMQGKGAGRVTEVNLELERLKIDFEAQPGVSVGFSAAGKVLRTLPERHYLRRKLEDPEELRQMAVAEPPTLLRLVLEGSEKALTAGEIREAVAGIVTSDEWTSWWSAARSHPQVIAEGRRARHSYRWAASSDEASETSLRLFEQADLEGRIEIFRRESKRSTPAAAEMELSLQEIAETAVRHRPTDAFAIGVALERTSSVPEESPWHPANLIRDVEDPVALVLGLEDRSHRQLACSLIRDERKDWTTVYTKIVSRERDARILSELTSALSSAAPEALIQFVDDLMARPRKNAAAFVWLSENLSEYPLLEERNPLRLMQQILEAEGYPEFTEFRSRLQAAISKSDTLPHLISRLAEDQAEAAEQALKRAHLADYVRDALITAVHLRFPKLRQQEETPLYATAGSIASKREELRALLREEIPANRRAIEEARALGDLSENFEYIAARQRHEYLSARAAALDRDLGRARRIDFSRLDGREVRIGSRVTLKQRAGGVLHLVILGPWESEPEAGVISYESETAELLLGTKTGTEIELDGEIWTVTEIVAFADR